MNYRNAYSINGSFDPELLYIELYNSIPNKFTFNSSDDNERDSASICFDVVKDLFKNVLKVRQYTQVDEEDPSEVERSTSSLVPEFLFKHKDVGSFFSVAADHTVVFIKYDSVVIYYEDKTTEEVTEFAEKLFYSFPPKKSEDKSAKISLIKVYQGDYYTEKKDIKPTVLDISENYNDDFKQAYEDTIKFLNERSSGLVLYWGAPGTGKTTLIRHLCSTAPKEYVVVPNSIAMRLGDPDLTTFITDHTDSVFILEDCEQLLEDRGENPFNNAIATILNMADGLLSDVCNIKFICTFNAPISKIDPALLRKGRCVAKYEFGKLSKEKVAHLNEKYNLGHEEIKEMTLAEVYNPDKVDYSEKEKELKIGF